MEESDELQAPNAFTHRYPPDRRMGGPQSQSGRSGEEKNSRPLLGLEPPFIQSVAQRCQNILIVWKNLVSFIPFTVHSIMLVQRNDSLYSVSKY
jgi:hypothetical protein